MDIPPGQWGYQAQWVSGYSVRQGREEAGFLQDIVVPVL